MLERPPDGSDRRRGSNRTHPATLTAGISRPTSISTELVLRTLFRTLGVSQSLSSASQLAARDLNGQHLQMCDQRLLRGFPGHNCPAAVQRSSATFSSKHAILSEISNGLERSFIDTR